MNKFKMNYMKNYFLFLFVFLIFISSNQAMDSLYLVSGHPWNSEEQFESALWKFEQDSLKKFCQLSTSEETLLNLKLYIEKKYFSLMKKETWHQEGHPYDSLLIFNIETLKLCRKSIDINKFHFAYLFNNFLIPISDNVNKIAIDLINIDKPVKLFYIGVNTNNMNIDSLELNMFQNVFLTGYIGGEVVGSDYILSYSRKEDGYLEILVTGDRSKRPCFPYELPEKFRFETYARQLICVNNNNYFLVSGNERYGINKLGSVPLFIYDKKNKKWIEKIITGTLPRIRGFSDWLCGYIGDDSKSLLNKPLPGSSLWQDRATGLSPAIRYEGMYAPGILYFYNPSTGVYFELETKQADSEVVLIQNEKVIYRVYDELYEAKLVNGKKLAAVKLLLKDDRVPDIHWAFYR